MLFFNSLSRESIVNAHECTPAMPSRKLPADEFLAPVLAAAEKRVPDMDRVGAESSIMFHPFTLKISTSWEFFGI